jgi:NADH-quinone oxidoreductase subunit H
MIEFWFPIILAPVLGFALLSSVPVILTIERKGAGWIQRRSGPNRVGPWGLMQPLSDAIKLVFKEVGIPDTASKALFMLAPVLAVIPPFLAFAAIPLGGFIHWEGLELPLQVANINVGLVFLLAITSLHVFSVLVAGWSSNNKFSLLGALRATSQMISYEIAIGISIVSMVMIYGTLDLREIVQMQEAGSSLPLWGAGVQPLCFLIMWVCAFAETNRLPFDLPEGESELVAGYHTEYSGLFFALFFLGEYAAMFLISAFMATLFLGGYNVPFVTEVALREFFMSHGYDLTMASIFTVGLQAISLIAKIFFFMWVFVWVRWTLPRFRYDQLMDLGWKKLLPLGILNVMITMVVTFWLSR